MKSIVVESAIIKDCWFFDLLLPIINTNQGELVLLTYINIVLMGYIVTNIDQFNIHPPRSLRI